MGDARGGDLGTRCLELRCAVNAELGHELDAGHQGIDHAPERSPLRLICRRKTHRGAEAGHAMSGTVRVYLPATSTTLPATGTYTIVINPDERDLWDHTYTTRLIRPGRGRAWAPAPGSRPRSRR